MPEPGCGAVLLAAGASSRLGQPKQLVRIEGEPLLRRAVRMACEAGCDPVAVVLGYEAEWMRGALDGLAAMPVVNEEWREGIGSSLRFGAAALIGLDACPGNILLLVCDQVALSAELLRGLLRIHGSDGAITAARYGGRLGVPAVFSSDFFPELLAVAGDQGAREILKRHAGQVRAVDFPGGELDLDTPEQLGAVNR